MSQPWSSTCPFTSEEYQIKSTDGTEISVWRIASINNTSLLSPAVVHAHGGGFIVRNLNMESLDLNRFRLKPMGQDWLKNSGVVLLYVAYRLATEKPFPAPAEDVYSTLQWAMKEEVASKLRIDRHKLGLSGYSAGGNLALHAALKAKNNHLDPPVCGLMLIYPMLDPCATWDPPPRLDSSQQLVWNKDKAFLREGWETYLGKEGSLGAEKKFAYLLSKDLEYNGLPATYLDVGTMDLFLEEDRKLKERLQSSVVDLTYAEWDGMPHNFEAEHEASGLHAEIVGQARQKRMEFWERVLFDRSC